jgi:xanthine dehydrogenase accessory factor
MFDRWLADGQASALATIVQTWGCSPRQVGAKMVLITGGQVCGSVSGGCLEGAVPETGLDVIAPLPEVITVGGVHIVSENTSTV